MKGIPSCLFVAFLALVGWSAYHPYDVRVWWMEMVWVLGIFGILAVTYRWFKFSNAAYTIVFVWLALHTIGAHYTFERVPMDWLKDILGMTRNPYDRMAHFAVGLNSFMLAELYYRKRCVSGRMTSAAFSIVSIVAMAGLWEIIEWIAAEWEGGGAGLAFLGSQGDVWDAQKDMLADTLGAIVGAAAWMSRGRKV